MFNQIPVAIVAGMSAETRAIGKENGLLWHVPEDLKRFKALTLGKPVIMGRKTFESIVAILGKPLPERTNIVVTRNADFFFFYPGAITTTTIEEAFEMAALEKPTEIHIGGGAEMYRWVLPFVDRIYLTVFDSALSGDAFFPAFESEFTEIARSDKREHDGLTYTWIDYTRNS